MSSPLNIRRHGSRRPSFLDAGGPNSLNNFVGSINRSASFGQFNEYHPDDLGAGHHSLVVDDEGDFPVFDETSSLIEAAVTSVPPPTGESTVYQTTFNAINVLVGMGILSLPLGFRLAGWIPGLIGLTLGPICTRYTAILLGRILDVCPQLHSYSDIGQYCLDKTSYSVLVFVFIVDLFGAALTLVLLFADSFSSISTIPATTYKAFICGLLFFLSFLPLASLSFLSVAGILSVSCIIASIGIAGFTTLDAPGSILNPMPTQLWPESYTNLLIAVGIFMAPWGGHVVFPELMRDMRHPYKYKQAVTASYTFAYSVDVLTASLGFLMFGLTTLPEVTNNILLTSGFPTWIKNLITLCMGLLPIAKLPLFTLPVTRFLEGAIGGKGFGTKALARVIVASLLYIVSTYVVNFGKVMSVLGSTICIGTCITAPLIFYLLIFRGALSKTSYYSIVGGIVVSVLVSCVGTWAGVVGEI